MIFGIIIYLCMDIVPCGLSVSSLRSNCKVIFVEYFMCFTEISASLLFNFSKDFQLYLDIFFK